MYGKPRISSPQQLYVRWEEGISLNLSPETAKEPVTATVFTDRPVPIRSILWKGKVEELPDKNDDLHQVLVVKYTPDIKGRNIRHTLFLGKSSDTLPTAIS